MNLLKFRAVYNNSSVLPQFSTTDFTADCCMKIQNLLAFECSGAKLRVDAKTKRVEHILLNFTVCLQVCYRNLRSMNFTRFCFMHLSCDFPEYINEASARTRLKNTKKVDEYGSLFAVVECYQI